MKRFSANVTMLFQEVDFLERFASAKGAGFDSVEFLFPYQWGISEIKNVLNENRLTVEMFNMPPGDWAKGERGLAIAPQHKADFRQSVEQALDYATALGAKKLHCMAGIGELGNSVFYETYLENLTYAAGRLKKHQIKLLLEPLNPLDMPGYALNNFYVAENIIRQLDNVFLQFDVFHCQKIHGNITHNIKHFEDITAHYQVAGVPQRSEPDKGELNYAHIFKTIFTTKYSGNIGCEYIPEKETVIGLSWIDTLQAGEIL